MNLKIFVLFTALLMYLLVILFQEKKVWFTTAAALVLAAAGFCFPGLVFRPDGRRLFMHLFIELINWNVLMIYVGSMVIAALFIYSKMPSRIADFIVGKSPSTGIAIVLILAMTGIISIFVENVATVLVMAPIALSLCKKLRLNPTVFLLGLAVMSNLEGTATLVGDPPSMIFASYAGYTFNDFFVYAGRPSIFFVIQTGMLAGCVFFYIYFRNAKEKVAVQPVKVVSSVPLILLLLMITGLAAISFLHIEAGYASGLFVFALGIAGILWYWLACRQGSAGVKALLRELDWETIGFLTGIFVVVGAVSEAGLLSDFAVFLERITGGSKICGFLLILLVSIFISGFVDNVPYIIVMLPVADSLASSTGVHRELFMFALLTGSCLGGNLTPFGASANVVASGILKKEGHPAGFSGWLRVCGPFTLITVAAASAFLWFVWK